MTITELQGTILFQNPPNSLPLRDTLQYILLLETAAQEGWIESYFIKKLNVRSKAIGELRDRSKIFKKYLILEERQCMSVSPGHIFSAICFLACDNKHVNSDKLRN